MISEKEKTDLKFFAIFIFLSAGLYFYGFYIPVFSLSVTVISLLFLYFLFIKQPGSGSISYEKPLLISLFLFGVIFLSMRFFNITGFPGEFIADERNEIVEAYRRISGDKSFFSYSKRFGASLLYTSTAVISIFMKISRENIDLLRLIPVFLSAAAAAAAFFLGKELKDKKTGIALFLFMPFQAGPFFSEE
ncbi:MAG: hypothetical protein ACLFP1_03060 [Candidatus Goldiibacteriota bacterium]